MRAHALALALAVALSVPGLVRADPETDLGLNARSAALAGAVSATGGDFAAGAYNPGALITADEADGFAELGVSFVTAIPAVWVASLSADRALDVQAPPNVYALSLGGRFDVGSAFGLPGLVLGLSLYTPLEGLVRSTIRPDDSFGWFGLDDRTRHISVSAALAYRVAPWLSLGVGARVTFDEEVFITGRATDLRRTTDPETGEVRVEAGTRLGIDAAIYGRASPIVGALVSPIPELRFAFTWRGRLFGDDWGYSRLQGIEGLGDIGFVHRFSHVYRPHELVWGAAVRPVPELEISADLTWALWSEAVSPNFATLGGRFGDTLSPAVGVRVTPTLGMQVMAGYRYARAPLANLGGPTNLLINDTHHASAGLELDLDALSDEELPFTVGLAGRLAIFEDATEEKNGRRFDSDSALLRNPGYPGYRFGGVVPSVQLTVEIAW